MKPVEASGRHTTDSNKPTPSFTPAVATTTPKHAIFRAGEPQDITKHDAGKRMTTQDGIFGTDEPPDAIGRDILKPTPSVATPPQGSIFSEDGQRETSGNVAGKPTQSFAKPFDVSPRHGPIFGTNESHAIRQDYGKLTPSVARLKDTIFSAGEPRDAAGHDVAEQRRA
jgi:hypothetical protein